MKLSQFDFLEGGLKTRKSAKIRKNSTSRIWFIIFYSARKKGKLLKPILPSTMQTYPTGKIRAVEIRLVEPYEKNLLNLLQPISQPILAKNGPMQFGLAVSS